MLIADARIFLVFLFPPPGVPQNAVEEAMNMYQELHRWDECIAVAEAKVYSRFCLLHNGSELGSTNIRNLLLSRRL